MSTLTTTTLSRHAARGVRLLVSLGYGKGNDFMPFHLHELKEHSTLTMSEVGAINAAINAGLVERGRHTIIDHRVYWQFGSGKEAFGTPDGRFRLTPEGLATYEQWYMDEGWQFDE